MTDFKHYFWSYSFREIGFAAIYYQHMLEVLFKGYAQSIPGFSTNSLKMLLVSHIFFNAGFTSQGLN